MSKRKLSKEWVYFGDPVPAPDGLIRSSHVGGLWKETPHHTLVRPALCANCKFWRGASDLSGPGACGEIGRRYVSIEATGDTREFVYLTVPEFGCLLV